MFVGARVPPDGAHVHAALVGEGTASDVGRMRVGREVRHLGHEAAQRRQFAELARGHAAPSELELEVGCDREQVRVAAAFSVAVHRTLHVRRARAHRGEAVGDGQAPIVVRVNAEAHARKLAPSFAERRRHVLGKAASVRIAEHEARGTSGGRRGERRRGVAGVVPVAVEEMLGVVDHLTPFGAKKGDGLFDHAEVLLRRGAQHTEDVAQPALAEDGHHGRPGLQERAYLEVVARRDARACGAPECRELGTAEVGSRGPGEELPVLRVGPGPASLDVAHPKASEALGDAELVPRREAQSFPLRAVPKRRVVERHVRESASPARSHQPADDA